MLAYSQVDANIRRKLEEMLKTWREPVPGSLSNTPVFPLPSTQTIVDSLNRFRASSTPVPRASQVTPANRAAQIIQPQLPHRNTPTPPQTTLQYPTSTIPAIPPTAPLPSIPSQVSQYKTDIVYSVLIYS